MGYTQKAALQGHTALVRKVEQVDSSGKIVTVSNDNTVKIWSVKDGHCVVTSNSHTDAVQDVSVLHENAIVTVGADSNAIVTQVSDGAELASQKFSSNLQTCTALSTSMFVVGDKGGNITKLQFDAENSSINVIGEKEDAHEGPILESYSHGGTFATASFDNTVKLWTSNLSPMHTFRRHNSWAMCVEYNDKYLVSGGADNTVQVYNMNDFSHACTIRRTSTIGFGRILCVAITKDSKTVVSGGDDKVIMLHSLPSGDEVARFSMNMVVYDICIMSSGYLAVVGQGPKIEVNVLEIEEIKARKWSFNFPRRRSGSFTRIKPKTSHMEDAFTSVLKDPTILDVAFIEKNIRAKYVRSAADLFCGHNLVLLAVRSQVLTRETVLRFKGDLWYFQENLYYPASKLTRESGKMLYPIFHHAEDIGLIKDGHKFRVTHEERINVNTQIGRLEESVMELSRRMNRLEDKFDHVVDRVKNLEEQVEKNTENFQNLFAAIKRKEKFQQYAGVAKIGLSLIPFVGNALANGAYEATNLALVGVFENTMNELNVATPDDMIGIGSDLAKAGVDNVVRKKTNLAHAQVDLSNMAVAYFMVSARGMDTMNRDAQDRIKDAISKTDFGDIETLRIMLKTMMRQNAKEDVATARLDVGESLRDPVQPPNPIPQPNPVTRPRESPRPKTETKPEEAAILHFQAKAAGTGSKTLAMHVAWEALTQTLQTLNVNKRVSEDEFEEMFMDICDDDMVSEKTFLKVFRKVIKGVTLNVNEETIRREFAEIFEKKLGKKGSYRLSARILYNELNDRKKKGKFKGLKLMSVDEIRSMFQEWDKDKDGNIDVDEFTDAAINIIRGSD